MFAAAALAQLWASNARPEPPLAERTYCMSPRFGFGVTLATAARSAVISPRPAAFGFPVCTARAVRIRAPLT